MEDVEHRDLSLQQISTALLSGLLINTCVACSGEGFRGYTTSHPNDPDARGFVDSCDECGGTGNGRCPHCGDSSTPFLVAGDGRCAECVTHDAVEIAEEHEDEIWMGVDFDGFSEAA